jgi:hypothetical protein
MTQFLIHFHSFSQTKDLTDCISVLIDGDQAVNWKTGREILELRYIDITLHVFINL